MRMTVPFDALRSNQKHHQERREDPGRESQCVAHGSGADADVGGEQFRNVNGEPQGDQNINRDGQEKSHEGKQNRVTKERINSAEKNSHEGSTDDGGLAPKGIGCQSADGGTAGVPIVISKEYLKELAMPRPCCTKKVGSR